MNQFSKGNRKRSVRPSRRLSTFEALEARLVLSRALLSMDDVAGEILVEYEPAANVQVRAANRYLADMCLVREIDAPVRNRMGFGAMEVVRIAPGGSVETAVGWLSRQPGVRFAEANESIAPSAIANDPEYVTGSLWGMYGDDMPEPVGPAGTTNAFGMAAENLWNQGVTGSSSVFVGIVDEGVDITHPDLVNNVWMNPYDPVDGRDNDGNGYVDDFNGWDFAANDRTVYDGPSDDHGTHVAGIIAAQGGNGVGVAGVGWHTKLIVTKFMGQSGGTLDGAIRALDYLTDLKIRHGMDIVASNNSWIGGGYSRAMHEAILRAASADILFVAAAGNYGIDNDAYMPFPSSFTSLMGTETTSAATFESVIAVAAIDSAGRLPSYSSYGAKTVDIAAPGSAIRSTYPGGIYGSNSGTSMATAHVSGAIALLKSAQPGAPAWKLKAAMYRTAVATDSLTGKVATAGRVNVDEATRSEIWDLPSSFPTAMIDDATIVEGPSGVSTLRFPVRLSNATDVPVTCEWSTSDATALAGTDYAAAAGTLVIPAGETQGVIEVEVFGDRSLEGHESFSVHWNAISNAYIEKAEATGMIVNDDYLPPEISVLDAASIEGNNNRGKLEFVVTLSAAVPEPLEFDFFTIDGTATAGTDYVASSGRLTIPAGEISATITVPILGDRLVEEDETLALRISLTDPWFMLSRDEALGTILDDDAKRSKGGGRGNTEQTATGTDSSLITIPVRILDAAIERGLA